MDDPVRWGFLGAGLVATQALAPAVHAAAGAVLQVVAARDPARALGLGPVRTAGSYDAVLRAGDVDAVYVALPNDMHLPWVLAATAAGKHVLCEKPLGRSAGEASAMAAAAEGAGVLLVEAAWNRWHPRTRRLEALAAGLGDDLHVQAWFTFPGPAPGNYRLDHGHGGGALLDVGCYAVALAGAVIGGPVRAIAADQHRVATGVDLTTTAVLLGPHGRAEITASFERPESQGFVVQTPGPAAGRLELRPPAFTSWREPSVLRVETAEGARDERFSVCDAYRLMVEAVSARIRGDRDAWVLPLAESITVAARLDEIASVANELSCPVEGRSTA